MRGYKSFIVQADESSLTTETLNSRGIVLYDTGPAAQLRGDDESREEARRTGVVYGRWYAASRCAGG